MTLRRRHFGAGAGTAGLIAVALLGACGGDNPLDDPQDLQYPGGSGRKLAYAYYQRCIFPILVAQLPVHGGTTTCGGCHDNATGTGGALRVIRGATPLDVTDAANTPDVIRASDMYKNYYSALEVTIPGDPRRSRLLAKPLLLNMLHGGGQVFDSEDDPNARLVQFWIDHPVPRDEDEFSTAAYRMFTPPDPNIGTCRTQ